VLGRVDVVELARVQAEDLLLGLHAQRDAHVVVTCSAMTSAKYRGRGWMKGMSTASPAVDVGLLHRDPPEVLDAGHADVLDDEVEVREVRGDVVDLLDVERVLVQRPDRRPLVDVDVLDAELDALLQVALRPGIVEAPAAGVAPPLGRVELDALDAPALDLLLERREAASPSRGSQALLRTNRSGYRSSRTASRAVVLKPST
jgi:hypothetical protein